MKISRFSTVKFNAYFSLESEVSSVDYVPTVGSYYPGSQVYSDYSISDGTINFSGSRAGTYLCLVAGRVYSHWTPGQWDHYNGGSYWHEGYWTTSVEPSSFKRVN